MAATTRSGGIRTTGEDNFPVDGVPTKPSHLSKEASAVWSELLKQIPAELLRKLDSYQLGVLCGLIVREKKLAKLCDADPADFKAGRMHLGVAQHISRLSGMFGLSPVDRRRIKFSGAPAIDEVDEWMQGRMEKARGRGAYPAASDTDADEWEQS